MQQQFLGFDHIDTRVRRLKDVEEFYQRLMPALGLPNAHYAYVDERGEWDYDLSAHPYNVVEFHQEVAGQAAFFIGFIEDPNMHAVNTRIAFRVASKEDLPRWHAFLESIGAVNIEPSLSEGYPAIFFEDACGTKLEICARLARSVNG